jgi:hypothetical protein
MPGCAGQKSRPELSVNSVAATLYSVVAVRIYDAFRPLQQQGTGLTDSSA